MILQGRSLIKEPEFNSIGFDTNLMEERVLEVLKSRTANTEETTDIDAPEGGILDEIKDEDETVGEQFRQEILPCFLTPEFLHKITHALTACETRLNRTGQQRRAEIALVARSIFELAEPQILVFHPLVLGITATTLERLLNQSELLRGREQRDFVQEVISDMRNSDTTEEDVELKDDEIDEAHTDDFGATVYLDDEIGEEEFVPSISSEELPARALYQNSDTLKTRKTIETWDGYKLVNDTTEQVEFLQPDLKRYITLTRNRLLLHCTSMTDLEIAMTEVEKQCESELIYLAKTLMED